eukprot:scaffold23940_cov112-Isochrysis_galbana.AAC.2
MWLQGTRPGIEWGCNGRVVEQPADTQSNLGDEGGVVDSVRGGRAAHAALGHLQMQHPKMEKSCTGGRGGRGRWAGKADGRRSLTGAEF